MIGATKLRIAALCCFAVFYSGTAAFAQQVPQRRPLATAPAPAKAQAKAQQPPAPATPAAPSVEPELIEISLNKAKVISLNGPVSKIIIGNEAIATLSFDPDQPTFP